MGAHPFPDISSTRRHCVRIGPIKCEAESAFYLGWMVLIRTNVVTRIDSAIWVTRGVVNLAVGKARLHHFHRNASDRSRNNRCIPTAIGRPRIISIGVPGKAHGACGKLADAIRAKRCQGFIEGVVERELKLNRSDNSRTHVREADARRPCVACLLDGHRGNKDRAIAVDRLGRRI